MLIYLHVDREPIAKCRRTNRTHKQIIIKIGEYFVVVDYAQGQPTPNPIRFVDIFLNNFHVKSDYNSCQWTRSLSIFSMWSVCSFCNWVSCNVHQYCSFYICSMCLFLWSGRFDACCWHSHEFVFYFVSTKKITILYHITIRHHSGFFSVLLLFYLLSWLQSLTHEFSCASNSITHHHNKNKN